MDIAATCLDAADATYPNHYRDNAITPMEGKTLLPIFTGQTRQGHSQLFFEHYGHKAVREGKWKLVSDEDGPWQLYHLGNDPSELHDVAEDQPEMVERLASDWRAWAIRTNAMQPSSAPAALDSAVLLKEGS